MGIQRSASVVACYLLKYGITNGVQITLDFIRSKRDVAFSTGTCSHNAVSLAKCNFLQAIRIYAAIESFPKTDKKIYTIEELKWDILILLWRGIGNDLK